MGSQEEKRAAQVDAWLANGGTVLAATERAARSVASAFHTTRRAEGRKAWLTPSIFSWDLWVRERWLERNQSGTVALSTLQEQALWTQIIQRPAPQNLLHPVLHPGRLANAAQRAYRLLCEYAPDALRSTARSGWSGDAVVFHEWMEAFDSRCRRDGLVSQSRLAIELTEALRRGLPSWHGEETPHSPLLLIGFDRFLPAQQALLDLWGDWQREQRADAARSARFVTASDAAEELQACAQWARAKLRENPEARLMVVATGLQERRGELERAFLEQPESSSPHHDEPALDFEFSMGVPLGRVSLARSAILLLRWLHEPLSESELDWLLSSRQSAPNSEEELALMKTMHEARRRGLERPSWSLDDFALTEKRLRQRPGQEAKGSSWTARLLSAREQLRALPPRHSPLEWAITTSRLLEAMGWPGFRPLASFTFQARQRWEQLLEECGALGLDGSQMEWVEFVATLAQAVSATIFAAESSDTRVEITEPLESAGRLADGIWFLGAHEDNWPGRGQPHPLLPIGLQRETGMPHVSPLGDWKLAQEATARLISSADEVIFSYARHSPEAEMRPSRLIVQQTGHPDDFPEAWKAGQHAGLDRTELFADDSLLPFPHLQVSGGADTLRRQSLCPFQAFSMVRLNSEDWQPAEAGLNAKQRGQLLHAVLHRVWGGAAQGGISSLEELQNKTGLRAFAGEVVNAVVAESFDPARSNSLPARFPARYLHLEKERLTQLVSEWLAYEQLRLPFRVSGTEVKSEVTIAGRTLKLRLDRIDRLANGKQLIVDYKTSDVGPKAWTGERPDDVQLPLYATFAYSEDLEGLVFARVRPGNMELCGRVRDARSTLLPDLHGANGLVKNPLTDEQLEAWRERIEQLGEDFLAGCADVDPKDAAKTCKSCHLHAVCRIYENQPLLSAQDEEDGGGSDGDGGESTGGADA